MRRLGLVIFVLILIYIPLARAQTTVSLPIISKSWDGTPPPTPTITPTPAPNPRGITVFNRGDETTLNASWYYNWGPTGTTISQTEFIPMFRPGNLSSAILYSQTLAGKYVLGFNEPDILAPPDSDGIGPVGLIEQWHTLEQSLPNSLLVGPGLSNIWYCYGEGQSACEASRWDLYDFLEDYHTRWGTWPRLAAVSLHFYQHYDTNPNHVNPYLPTNRASFYNFIGYNAAVLNHFGQWYDPYWSMPIWLTEFGYQPHTGFTPDAAAVATGLQQWLGQIHSWPRIQRYAYFCARENLFTSDPLWWPMSLLQDDIITLPGQVYRDY